MRIAVIQFSGSLCTIAISIRYPKIPHDHDHDDDDDDDDDDSGLHSTLHCLGCRIGLNSCSQFGDHQFHGRIRHKPCH